MPGKGSKQNKSKLSRQKQSRAQLTATKINGNDIRRKFLQFLKQKQHAIVPSQSLTPENDPTTLFTTAGMQWMLPYLLGQEHPSGTRVANSQQCLRAEDIEEVGDNRHTTFFEMLGNWSFGDYFKKQQLAWFFHFLVDEVDLDPARLYVTVFKGSKKYDIPRDQEAIYIWQELFAQYDIQAQVVEDPEETGLPALVQAQTQSQADASQASTQTSTKSSAQAKIFLYTWENWWSRAGQPDNMPVGEPGGPDSEVFYDFGPELKLHEHSEFVDQPCHLNCDCGRFLEIGNSVFMQFKKTKDGFVPLEQKNIDFGGGLERITAAAANQIDIFQTSLFQPIITQLEAISAYQYQGENKENFRIIADHLKAAVMLIADGVMPDNKDQGYMVRRLLRRAIRYGKLLGIEQPFLAKLVPVVVELYQKEYQYLTQQRQRIQTTVKQEVEKFERTLERGLAQFAQAMEDRQELTGALAFRLYETYGFPLEMSIEEAQRQGLEVDDQLRAGFNQCKREHQQQSRAGAKERFSGGLADTSDQTTRYHTVTHLLHAALRQVLGEQVEQQGSNITQERLRFDFNHPQALQETELTQVENLVNDWIKQELPVDKETMDKEQALDSGALATFKGRYPDRVTVYTIATADSSPKPEQDWVSRELCGGPHVSSTAQLKPIEIYKEKSASAGVRRIYAREKN